MSVTWIRDGAALAALAEALRAGPALALDSESDSLHHHVEKVCLLQLCGADGRVALVDTLALRDLSPLAPLMADPALVKVLHGADYDVTTLKRDFGFEFAGLFDTMIAARFLGRAQFGLQALAAAELGVTLSKDSQTDDWSRRPLTPRQESYAADDVRHLLVLRERLEAALLAAGRLDWVLEECAAVAALPAAERRRDAQAFLRLKGATKLARRSLAVLREAWAWREAQAEESDIPSFKLVSTEALLELAQSPPASEAELRARRGLSPRLKGRLGGLLEAVRRGQSVPPDQWPEVPRSPRPVIPAEVQARVQRLRAWRQEEGARLALDISLVLPQRLIDKLAEAAPRSLDDLRRVEGLREWRCRTWGEALLQRCR